MSPILANAGLPMIGVQLNLMTLALVPVVAVEAFVLYRTGAAPTRPRALAGATVANLVSTFVGIPIAWFGLALLEIGAGMHQAWGMDTTLRRVAAVTLQAPWLIPYEEHRRWMVPAAAMVLLLPCLIVSIFVEGRCLRLLWPDADPRRLRIGVRIGNLLTYSLLLAFLSVRLALALRP